MSSNKQNLIEEALRVLGSGDSDLKSEMFRVSKRGGKKGGMPEQSPGGPAIDVNGNTIPNSIALGFLTIAYRDGREIIIESEGVVSGERFLIEMDNDALRNLKNL